MPVTKRERDGGTELFRCLMMLLVVCHHATLGGSFRTSPAAVAIFLPTMFAVDGFVAISGWYGIRFSWGKWFRLWGVMAFYGCLELAARCVAHMIGWKDGIAWTCLAPGGWFAGSYLALMAVTPFLNAGLEALARESPKRIWSAWGVLAVAMALSWLPHAGFLGVKAWGWGSHCVATLVFVYVTLRVFRLGGVGAWLTSRRLAWGLALTLLPYAALYTLYHVRRYLLAGTVGAGQGPLGYNTPFVVLGAACLFLCFTRLRPTHGLAQGARLLGPSMFGVYLIHEALAGGRRLFLAFPQAWLAEHLPCLGAPGCILLSTVFCFAVCAAIDLARRALFACLAPMIAPFRERVIASSADLRAWAGRRLRTVLCVIMGA